MKAKTDIPDPEFSYTLSIEKIPASGVEEDLLANETQRRKLAERFGLLGLPSLRAKLAVKPDSAGYSVTGTMIADVVQQCVVTLEPLDNHIEQDIHVSFRASEAIEAEKELLPDESDVEAIMGGVIDLGELLAQHLGLALDRYPREPGLALVPAEYGDKKAAAGSLAKLAEWKKSID
jgi:hypothetical protein